MLTFLGNSHVGRKKKSVGCHKAAFATKDTSYLGIEAHFSRSRTERIARDGRSDHLEGNLCVV